MRMILHGRKVYASTGLIENGTIRVADSQIVGLGRMDEMESFSSPEYEEEFILEGDVLLPGFVDLQVNGAGGKSLNENPDLVTLEVMGKVLARSGCTSFLPTIISAKPDQILDALNVVGNNLNRQFDGAQVLGVHLEGPFLNPEKAGVHNKKFLSLPSVKALNEFWEASQGSIRLMTLAPELPGAFGVIREARRLGIKIALGHTMAGEEECERAIDEGAILATHLFNAMYGPSARDPGNLHPIWGVPQVVFRHPELSVSLIADGIHVHPKVLDAVFSAKGSRGILLVSDSMPPTGTKTSQFYFQEEQLTVRDGACYTANGVLGGSILTMDQAVRNMSNWIGVPLMDAVTMASYNPASILGYEDRIGGLEVGKKADIVVCDKNLIPVATVVHGKVAFTENH